MADFTASTRVPTRPLSYDNIAMAYKKEFVVDYHTGLLYVVDEEGNIINVTSSVYQALIDEYDFNKAESITIVIKDPDDETKEIVVNLQTIINDILDDIDVIKNNYNTLNELLQKIKQLILNAKGELEIPAPAVKEDDEHMFVTKEMIKIIEGVPTHIAEYNTLKILVEKIKGYILDANEKLRIPNDAIVTDSTHRWLTDTMIAEIEKIAGIKTQSDTDHANLAALIKALSFTKSGDTGTCTIPNTFISTDSTHRWLTDAMKTKINTAIKISEETAYINYSSVSSTASSGLYAYSGTISVANLPTDKPFIIAPHYSSKTATVINTAETNFDLIAAAACSTAGKLSLWFYKRPTASFNIRVIVFSNIESI